MGPAIFLRFSRAFLLCTLFAFSAYAEDRYAEMRRVFLLVDPLFVTEDIGNGATRPEHRFNEVNLDGRTQPAWENFNRAYDELLETLRRSTQVDMVNKAYELHRMLLRGNVDGTPESALDSGATKQWRRSPTGTFSGPYMPYTHEFTLRTQAWNELPQAVRDDAGRFFNYTTIGSVTTFRFRSESELRENFSLPPANGRTLADILIEYVANEVNRLRDPVERAAKILYLLPRLHPYSNGMGRLARLWAAVELERAGLSIPVGIPTNDFFLTEDQMIREVRRGVLLGERWQAFIEEARRRGIPPERFFQEAFRGSSMEGMILFRPTFSRPDAPIDMETHLGLLEVLARDPRSLPAEVEAWAREHARRVHDRISARVQARLSFFRVRDLDEFARHDFLREISDAHPPGFGALVAVAEQATNSPNPAQRARLGVWGGLCGVVRWVFGRGGAR